MHFGFESSGSKLASSKKCNKININVLEDAFKTDT